MNIWGTPVYDPLRYINITQELSPAYRTRGFSPSIWHSVVCQVLLVDNTAGFKSDNLFPLLLSALVFLQRSSLDMEVYTTIMALIAID